IIPLAFALFSGRSFCASVCPLGAMQELVVVKPLRVPRVIEHILGLLPWLYLAAAFLYAMAGSAFLICRYDPFIGFYRFGASYYMLVAGVAILFISMFVGRAYCRFACPYGALLKVFSKVAKHPVTVTPNECIECRLCENACPYGAIVPPSREEITGKRKGKRMLGATVVFLPLLVLAGIYTGNAIAPAISHENKLVQMADNIYLNESGEEELFTEGEEYLNAGNKPESVYARSEAIQNSVRTWSILIGAILGFALGIKLISLCQHRLQTGYWPDAGACFACGRCFSYCPKHNSEGKEKEESRE
ncbi:MAG: 4Fe-4S binding protein, partial [Planctomycetes bacterium]|nr:4Fe-4S binding protein [Planctomycetota bacterium]